jgi:hypothetical protein
MAPHHPHRSAGFMSAGAPALIPFAFGDTDTSIGAVGLAIAILILVALLLTVIVIEVAGEHRDNVANRRHHR